MRPRRIFPFPLLVVYLLIPLCGVAQETKPDATQPTMQQPPKEESQLFQFSGEAGVYGELYAISGRDARRPNSTARLFFRPTLSVFDGLFTIGFNILLSTEENTARQSLNNIGINPTWSWGRAYIWDFTPTFSQYVLSDVTLRGGGLELYPGSFRLFTVGGKTQRAVAGGLNTAYDRTLYGAKLGLATQSGFALDVSFIRTKDDAGSAPSTVVDTIKIDSLRSEVRTTVLPQENIVASISTQIPITDNALVLRGEFAGTVYSRDVNSSGVDVGKNVPEFLSRLTGFDARVSSAYDYAWNVEADVNLAAVSLRGGYQYIGPGYLSWGLASLINDRRGWFAGFGLRVFNGDVTLRTNVSSQQDNILGQKLLTTTRTAGTATLGVRPAVPVFLNVGVTLNAITNDAAKDSAKVDYLVTIYNVLTSYQFTMFGQSSSLNLSYAFQRSEDANQLRRASNMTAHTVTGMGTVGVSSAVSISPTVGYTTSMVSDTVGSAITTAGVGVTYRAVEGRLPLSLTGSYSHASQSTSVGVAVNASYHFSAKDVVMLTERTTFLMGTERNVGTYTETIASLSYMRRF
jgi:hypothetical protein